MTADHTWAPVDVDQRDVGDDRDPDTVVGSQGAAISCLTVHVPGVTLRAKVYRELHFQIAAMHDRHSDPQNRRLCGVEHIEDIQPWQAPHTGRAELQKAIRATERRHRRPVVVIHGWQHIGPCPQQPTTAAPTAENGATQ